MWGYDDDSGAPTLEACGSQVRTTRKPRDCETCGEPIPVGTPYERKAIKVDGEIGAIATHVGH